MKVRVCMSMWVGVFLTILAAAVNGDFALPMKRSRKWAWEDSWMLYSAGGSPFVLESGVLARQEDADARRWYSSL